MDLDLTDHVLPTEAIQEMEQARDQALEGWVDLQEDPTWRHEGAR